MRGSGIGGAGLVTGRGICIRLFGPLASELPGYEPLAFFTNQPLGLLALAQSFDHHTTCQKYKERLPRTCSYAACPQHRSNALKNTTEPGPAENPEKGGSQCRPRTSEDSDVDPYLTDLWQATGIDTMGYHPLLCDEFPWFLHHPEVLVRVGFQSWYR